jgi:hypothetical protein
MASNIAGLWKVKCCCGILLVGFSPAFQLQVSDSLLDLRLILQVGNTRLLELSPIGLSTID